MAAIWTLRTIARRLIGNTFAPPSRPISNDLTQLSWVLHLPPEELLQFRSGRRDPRYHYRPRQCEKRDGSPRQLYAPSPDLKAVQRALLHGYLDGLRVHPAALGFRRGFNVADNARRHLGQAVVVTADIADFFDHTSAQRVRNFFRAQDWDEITCSVLTGLCTFRGALPQGAPTSPILSNLVNYELDEALIALAGRSGGRYTRYGDDLTFSWASRRRPPSDAQRAVRRILLPYGYRLNRKKDWRVYRCHKGEEPRVTGIRLGRNGRLHPSREIEQTMRRLRWQRDAESQARLRGYEGFVEMLRGNW
ncbi:MAG: reverse transcriptase domain-containing protein [Anaerolineales bacterium]